MIELTDKTIDAFINDPKTPAVVIDFWAEWCGPCKLMGPLLEKLDAHYKGLVSFGKLDINANPQSADKYKIEMIPAVLFFRKGKLVKQLVGFGKDMKRTLKDTIENQLLV